MAEMTDNYIIKACPFCGDSAYLDRHEIFCNCGAKMEIPMYVEAKQSVGGYPTYKEARQEMITAWNSRVDEEIINRQKAEIERLTNKVEELSEVLSDTIRIRYAEAKAEAVKEFAERLKAELEIEDSESWFEIHECVLVSEIDNLVKEMVGAESGK